MNELERLIDHLDDLDCVIAEPSELTDEEVAEITAQRSRLEKQVVEGIAELAETNPDLAAKIHEDFLDRATKWLDYCTSRLRVLKAVRMLKASKGELIA